MMRENTRRQDMDFQDLIRKRYSVRSYKPADVEAEKIARVLEAARLAPTAANRQPFRVIVISTRDRERELRRVYGRDWFTQAPLILAVCAVPSEGWVRRADGWNSAEVDATIAMAHIVLAAAEEGLGTCWIAAFDPVAARQVLGLPPDVIPSAFTPLGYPADSPAPKKRRTSAELIRRERW
jgi:nitroreductase